MIPSSIKEKKILIPYLMLLGFIESFDEKYKLTIYTKTTNNQYVIIFYNLGEDDYIYSNLYTKVIEDGIEEFKYSESNNLYGFIDIIQFLNTEFNHELRKIKINKILTENKSN